MKLSESIEMLQKKQKVAEQKPPGHRYRRYLFGKPYFVKGSECWKHSERPQYVEW